MRKIIYSILLTLFVLFPINVLAEGYISASPGSLTIEQGSSKNFTIIAYNAIGDVSIRSNNNGVASVNTGEWGTGMVDEKQTKTGTITVTGNSVGTTTITLTIDAATFDGDDLAGQTKTITVNVVAKPEPVPQPSPKPTPQPQPKPTPQPTDTRSNNTNLKSVKINNIEVTQRDGQYTLEISNYITNVDISAEVEDSKANVNGAGKKDIAVGNNSYDLVVTAENGRTATYKITVVRKEYNSLSDLEDILKQGIDADIVINEEDKLTSNDLDKIKNSKNKITLKKMKEDKILYKWILDNNITSVNEFNPNISLEIEDNDDMENTLNYPDGIYLDFRNCKDVPKGVQLEYYVSDKYKDGDKINIYIYDEKNDKVIELKNGLIVKDDYIKFEITKALRHVISKSTIGNSVPVVSEEKDTNIWKIVSIVLGILLIISFGIIIIKKNNNSSSNTKVEEKIEELDLDSATTQKLETVEHVETITITPTNNTTNEENATESTDIISNKEEVPTIEKVISNEESQTTQK